LDLVNLLRITKPSTLLLGPEYGTSMDDIEVDITFQCNLKCYNCDRSCTQAPDDSAMTTSQIKKFIDESIKRDKNWRRIRVLGGEPLLHPSIFDIIGLLSAYRDEYSPGTRVEVTTNGFGREVAEVLGKIPRDIWVNNTKKEGRLQKKFEAFNMAPADDMRYCLADFTNGCWITHDCGMGLNRYGYYQCAVAGSIDRVMGFDQGIKKLPTSASEFSRQKRTLCKYCGHFIRRGYVPADLRIEVNGEPQSKSWINAYRIYGRQKPILSLYHGIE
jgi:hypothetical protein